MKASETETACATANKCCVSGPNSNIEQGLFVVMCFMLNYAAYILIHCEMISLLP